MARRVTPSQFRSMIRQAEAKQRQNIQSLNNKIRQHNSRVRRYNTERKQAIDAYNRRVHEHNARVRSNRARLDSALRRLGQQTGTVRYRVLRQSAFALYDAYRRLDNADTNPFFSDLAERETANSAMVVNNLIGDSDGLEVSDDQLNIAGISTELSHISPGLDRRWHGAVYALNPGNPEAARHFCSSAREILTVILDTGAPDADVIAHFPNCQRTKRGTPTRRAKVEYCLDSKGMVDDTLEDFADANSTDLLTLFKELNAGTHGPSGKFSLSQLAAIKTRVEDGIRFICNIVN